MTTVFILSSILRPLQHPHMSSLIVTRLQWNKTSQKVNDFTNIT